MAKDNYPTIAAIALLAYLTADVTHHVLGHAVACLVLGGQIKLLSSVLVICSLTGSAIDLAGPLANLLTGLFALAITHTMRRMSSSTRLFLTLVVAFNFFWFYLQLVFSATTLTDDWAWFMKQFHINELSRYGLIAVGIAGYVFTIGVVTRQMAFFASPRARVSTIIGIAWASAGIIACATAAFDPHAAVVILKSALPQSMLLSIGLLLVPTRAAQMSSSADVATPLPFSAVWIVMAVLAGATSIVLLGPGSAFSS